jgi:hypothetical protein
MPEALTFIYLNMKYLLLLLLSVVFYQGAAQDLIYLADGSRIDGKVQEVGPEQIIVTENNNTRYLDKREVILIHYHGDEVQIFHNPTRNIVSDKDVKTAPAALTGSPSNLVSLNTLGLVNGDLMAFYERLAKNRKIGLGLFGGYNFNPLVNGVFNFFIYPLHNAKKQGDLGAFFNYYPRSFTRKRSYYYGISLKYTPIKFTSVAENSVTTGTLVTTNLVFTPAQGRQVAVMMHLGHHRQINTKLYVRTMAGLGFFRLTDEYKKQFNYLLNKNAVGPPVEFTALPKLFFAFHVGYIF